MSIGTTFRNDILKLIYNAVNIANLADNAAVSPLTTLYVSLHTADPNAGNQQTNEAVYPGYARVAVTRGSGGWVVTGNSVSPAAAITFPECNAAFTGTLTHAAVGTAASGAGKILDSGALSVSIPVKEGAIPQIKTTMTITRV